MGLWVRSERMPYLRQWAAELKVTDLLEKALASDLEGE
jgi:hypothetical protein